MRYAVISDIHANAAALDAVIEDARAFDAGPIVALGDIVGYHALVGETIQRLISEGVASVHGNHDQMMLGRLPTHDIGWRARRSLAWTRHQIGQSERAWLSALPATLVRDGALFTHAAPFDATLRSPDGAPWRELLGACGRHTPPLRLCFTGHTHHPGAWVVQRNGSVQHVPAPQRIVLGDDACTIVNPGSVGLSRDADARASYVIWDQEARAIMFRRVAWDMDRVELADAQAGLLPQRTVASHARSLAQLLAHGASVARGQLLAVWR